MASYTLHIQYVDRPAETRTFTQAKVTLGRDSGDIVLHDTQVSGKHGEITFDGNVLRYTDVGSTNGSFLLQGQRVANIELTPGIALRLGNSLITVQIIDAPNVAGKGRTVIAGPGMAPGFPAPMRPPGPAAPASALSASGSAIPRPGMPAPPSPPPGGFAFAPTAQMQSPMMPAGMPAAPAPQAHAFVPQPAPMTAPAPAPIPAPMAPAPMAPAPMAPAPMAPAPLPAPPGTFSGGAPAPMPAAPMPVAPMAAAPYAPAPATPQTLALAEDDAEAPADFVGALKAAGLGAWNGIKEHIVDATSITLIVGLPIALVSWVVSSFLDPTGSLSSLLQLVLRLAQAAGMLIVTPALVRFVLGVYLGQPVEWKATIREQVTDAKTVMVNFLIFGLIGAVAVLFLFVPALFVVAFIGQIYFVEGKRKLDAVSRNYEIVKRDWIPLAINVFVLAIVGTLAFMIPAIVLAMIHWTVGLLGVIIAAVGSAVLMPIIMMLLTQMYFRNRRHFEGGDPEGDARVRLAAAPLPEA